MAGTQKKKKKIGTWAWKQMDIISAFRRLGRGIQN